MNEVFQIQWSCCPTEAYGVGCAFIIRASLGNYRVQEIVTDIEIIASRLQIGFLRAYQMQMKLLEELSHDPR